MTDQLSRLAKRAKTSRTAFDLLIHETYPLLMRIANQGWHNDAEDIVQSFVLVFRKFVDRFERERGLQWIPFVSQRFRYFYDDYCRQKTNNRVGNFKTRKGERFTCASLDQTIPGDDNSKLGQLIPAADDPMSREQFAESLSSLSHIEREALLLCYYDGHTMTEAAVPLNVSPSGVSQIHNRSLRKLRGSFFEF